MTKKDYILISASLQRVRETHGRIAENFKVFAVLDEVANELSCRLANDNQGRAARPVFFDREWFLKACGVIADGVWV